jgi:DNA-binding LytR/AlgR family response regulator
MGKGWRIRLWRGWAVDLGVATAVGVFLGAVGPFGSYLNGPVGIRIAYWLVSVWTGTLVFGTTSRFILARRMPLVATGLVILASVAVLSIPFAGLVAVAAPTVWPRLEGFTYWDWYRQVLVITTPLALGYALLERARDRSTAPATIPPAEGLLGAPPPEVLCLQMEDHYVRVHTAGGSRLVLATLAQAISALKGAPGLQVHRSWWVAEKAVTGVVADGRNLRLQLANGITAPVARSAVAAVRAAGWLDRAG